MRLLRSHGDAGVVQRSYADDVQGVTPGQYRGFGSASCGVAPGDAGGGITFQGLFVSHPTGNSAATTGPDACAQDGCRQASRGHKPQGRHAPSPQPTRWRNRAGLIRLPQATGNVRPRAFIPRPQSVIPAKAGISREERPRSHPSTVIASRRRSNPGPHVRHNPHPQAWIATSPGCRRGPRDDEQRGWSTQPPGGWRPVPHATTRPSSPSQRTGSIQAMCRTSLPDRRCR